MPAFKNDSKRKWKNQILADTIRLAKTNQQDRKKGKCDTLGKMQYSFIKGSQALKIHRVPVR